MTFTTPFSVPPTSSEWTTCTTVAGPRAIYAFSMTTSQVLWSASSPSPVTTRS